MVWVHDLEEEEEEEEEVGETGGREFMSRCDHIAGVVSR